MSGPPPIEARGLRKVFRQATTGQSVVAIDRLDLRIEKRWKIRNEGGITLYLDVQNVLNQRHPEATVYGYDYRDTDDILGLPILPIIGVRGEL